MRIEEKPILALLRLFSAQNSLRQRSVNVRPRNPAENRSNPSAKSEGLPAAMPQKNSRSSLAGKRPFRLVRNLTALHAVVCRFMPCAAVHMRGNCHVAERVRVSAAIRVPTDAMPCLSVLSGLAQLTANVTEYGRHATGCPIHSRALPCGPFPVPVHERPCSPA